jgi:iron complex outermembrane recepter protein
MEMKGQSRAFVALLLAGVGMAGFTAPAFAQATAEDDTSALGEIVVTAQKRAESLQETPLAITAVPA